MDLPRRNNFPSSSSSSLSFSSLPSLCPSCNIFPRGSHYLAPEGNEAMVVNHAYPILNTNTDCYVGYGYENQWSQPPPTSLTPVAAAAGASWLDTFMAQELVTYCPDPMVNQNIHSYAGYGLEKRQSQTPSTLSARATSWPGAVVANTAQWEPHYHGSQQETSRPPYHPPAPMLDSYSATVVAESLRVVPPMGWSQWSPPEGDNPVAADPLTTAPHTNEGPDEYFVEQGKDSTAPTLASARGQNITEVTPSHRTFAGRRTLTPLYARPPAEYVTRNGRKARQVVGNDNLLAQAIAEALEHEMKVCESGSLECGPCFLRRKGELIAVKKSIDHEILYMLKYFNPEALQVRLVALEMRRLFERVVETHLLRPIVWPVHPCQRLRRPGHWEIRLAIDRVGIVVTRKDE